MKQSEIEWRIEAMQRRLSVVSHPLDIAVTNRIIEKLIMMESDEDRQKRLSASDSQKNFSPDQQKTVDAL